MKTIQINRTVEKELEKLPRWKLMLYLQENGESSVYKMAKDLNWSTGKTHSVVNALLRSKAVKVRVEIKNNRALKLVWLSG